MVIGKIMQLDNEIGLNYIDLFAGAGGLSEGFIQAGFSPVAHVEMNAYASKTLETRQAYYYLKNNGNTDIYYKYELGEISRAELFEHIPQDITDSVINKEMSIDSINGIFARIDEIIKQKQIKKIDVIIGGPPCQAYSLVGRAQSSHMLKPMEEDPRNELYKMYTRFLTKYKPEMFVFENVSGIKTARNGSSFKNLKAHLKRVGYSIDVKEQNAYNFGVLQNRKRVIIIGWKKGTNHYYPVFEDKSIKNAVVWDLLSDLPSVKRGEGCSSYSLEYDQISNYLRNMSIRSSEDVLTHHVARPNKDRDVEIYRRVISAWNNGHKRVHYDELPDELKTHKNRISFVDRFKVVEGDLNMCHTVLAHLSKDGHYFIHPDIKQCRSITVREAARLQSFPDNYFFEGPRTAQFVQIGNAVPPVMAKIIAEELKKQLGENIDDI